MRKEVKIIKLSLIIVKNQVIYEGKNKTKKITNNHALSKSHPGDGRKDEDWKIG